MTVEESAIGVFTCMACHVAFHQSELQRSHYQTDWHRYNLKRKVAELPPLSQQDYVARVQLQAKNDALTAQQAVVSKKEKRAQWSCSSCHKTFASENAHASHLRSKKHLESLKQRRGSAQIDAESVDMEQEDLVMDETMSSRHVLHPQDVITWQPPPATATHEEMVQLVEQRMAAARRLPLEECLFCTHLATSLETNLEHMHKEHAFLIPDRDYCVDVPGLVKHLGECISVGLICLHCGEKGRTFRSLDAVRRHMRDQGHCHIPYETEEEQLAISGFFDFRSSYPISMEGDEDAEMDALENAAALVIPDETALILPSGQRLGHRAYRRFYRQYLKPDEQRDSHLIHTLQPMEHALIVQGRTSSALLAPTGGRLVTVHEAKQMDRIQARHQRTRADNEMRIGVKGNKYLQPHYREQIL